MLMKQKNVLSLTISQLHTLYLQTFPHISALALESKSEEIFKEKFCQCLLSSNYEPSAVRHMLTLLKYNGKDVHELSTESPIRIRTITLLWQFLTEGDAPDATIDLFTDLYFQLKRLQEPEANAVERKQIEHWMNRYPTGLDEKIKLARQTAKERIIHLLIHRLVIKQSASSRYKFPENITYDEKYKLVSQWWDQSRFHLSMAIKSPSELNRFLNDSLSDETMAILTEAKKKKIPFFITPYYLSLLNREKGGFDDEAIRSYVLYSANLVETYGSIRAWEKEDALESGKPNAAGWLLPEGNNIHRRYPEVAILIPDTMGRACGGLCASCQRMYDFQNERLNFEFESLKPKESWENKLKRLMTYFEEDTQLRDILITGGDALMSQNRTLKHLLEAVYKMADRKQKANLARPDGQKYAELQRVRLGSRLPAYLPMRIDDELISILRIFKRKASQIGIKQFILQTHFQSPLEITPEAEEAIRKILSAGWMITNQLVFNVAASRRGHTAKLRETLNNLGVVCYYTFSVKGFNENRTVFAPNSRSLQEQQEEKVLGRIPQGTEHELFELIDNSEDLAKAISGFLKKHQIPFLATDRSVLNLPGVGKSMSFVTAGITPEGQRILRFNHDATRIHSPIIGQMKEIFIVENKSIREYMLQLEQMGEDIGEYSTLWHYTEGETEARFTLFEYPDSGFEITKKLSNLALE